MFPSVSETKQFYFKVTNEVQILDVMVYYWKNYFKIVNMQRKQT